MEDPERWTPSVLQAPARKWRESCDILFWVRDRKTWEARCKHLRNLHFSFNGSDYLLGNSVTYWRKLTGKTGTKRFQIDTLSLPRLLNSLCRYLSTHSIAKHLRAASWFMTVRCCTHLGFGWKTAVNNLSVLYTTPSRLHQGVIHGRLSLRRLTPRHPSYSSIM